MHKVFFAIIFSACCLTACNSADNTPHLTNALQSGREFIEASLKGDYNQAKKYIMPDSVNLMYFDRITTFYKNMSEPEKQGYKNANIIVNPTENVSDSVTIINYSNTYKNKPSKIKMVKINNQWLVDFKYTFAENL
ncbi:MAG: DUF4878 domain-containing protein [Chitinophagaceae bacterium]|nr:DUF4878 domain-containing protein [Chitinophagaceae bacterium]